LKKFVFERTVFTVHWNPTKNILAVASGETVYFVNANTGTTEQNDQIDQFLKHRTPEGKSALPWESCSSEEQKLGIFVKIRHPKDIRHLSWHQKGDYLVTVSPDAPSKTALYVHQITTFRSQNPFRKTKGKLQFAQFHPTKPYLFVANQQVIRIYNLAKLSLDKKLIPGAKWISSFDIHPGGDNIIMGSYDKRVCWFDLDLSNRPYKTLRYHKLAVRKAIYHKKNTHFLQPVRMIFPFTYSIQQSIKN